MALDQLRGLGLTESAVHKRAGVGRLHRIYRGVYALTPRSLLRREGRWMAAVLASGPGAALSHRSAAHLHGLRPTSRTGVDVIVPGSACRRIPGIDAHRSRTLTADDITVVDGIPVTTIARTVLDLAGVVSPRGVERALGEAEVRQLLDMRALDEQLARNHGSRAAAALRAVLGDSGPDLALTDSELEELFRAIWWATGLPRPRTRHHIDPDDGGLLIRADFAWPRARLTVETDGRRYHSGARSYERDRLRDQRLKLAGWDVVRVTERQLHDEPARIIRLVSELLQRRTPAVHQSR